MTWETRVLKKFSLYLSVTLVLFWCLEKPPTVSSNLQDVPRWLLQNKYSFHSIEVLANNLGGDSGHLLKYWENSKPFLCTDIISAEERVSVDLLKGAASEIAEVVSGGKNFRTAAKTVERQTLIKQLVSGSRKKSACRTIPTKTAKTNQWVARIYFHKHFSLFMSKNFRYHPFVEVSGNFAGKVPVVDDVLSSHEKKVILLPHSKKNSIKFEFQTDRYVDLRGTYLPLKLKFVKGRVYEPYNTKEV